MDIATELELDSWIAAFALRTSAKCCSDPFIQIGMQNGDGSSMALPLRGEETTHADATKRNRFGKRKLTGDAGLIVGG